MLAPIPTKLDLKPYPQPCLHLGANVGSLRVGMGPGDFPLQIRPQHQVWSSGAGMGAWQVGNQRPQLPGDPCTVIFGALGSRFLDL